MAQEADASAMSSTWFRCVAVTPVLDVEVDGWQEAQVVNVPVPPEPAGATACVAGGAAWQMAHEVDARATSSTWFRCVAVTPVLVVDVAG